MSLKTHLLAQTSGIGEGIRIGQFCVAFARARISRNFNSRTQVLPENNVVTGDNVTEKCIDQFG